MNVGIIVYSQTGNTLAVAQKIQATCEAVGHSAALCPITVMNPEKTDAPVVLLDTPACAGYDLLIFGAPVQAFTLCKPMALYLKQLQSLKGIPVGCFLTQGLPKPWMGGNYAYKTLRKLCLRKGADPVRLGHIHWKSDQRDEQIAATVSAAVKFASTVKAP